MLKGVFRVLGVMSFAAMGIAGESGDALQLGAIGTAGTGCLPGTELVKLKKDADGNIRRIELTARRFQVAAGAGKALDRKVCALAIPFDLPPGKILVVDSVEVAGSQNLARGTSSALRAEAFISAGEVDGDALILEREFAGPLATKFFVSSASGLASDVDVVNCQNAANAGILRANVSVVNRSEGKVAKAFTRLSGVAALNLKVLNCE